MSGHTVITNWIALMVIMEIGFIVVSLSLIAAIFGLIYYYLKIRSRERMALIQSGHNVDYFENLNKNSPFILQLGIVVLSISIGISTGGVISYASEFRYSLLIFMITISFFLSLSLIGCHFIEKRYRRKRTSSSVDEKEVMGK